MAPHASILRRLLALSAVLAAVPHFGAAKLVQKELTFTWQEGAPNGQARDMIFTNGAFPSPTLYVDEDDDVEITVHNNMHQNTTVHGPSCIELQLEYVCDLIKDMKAAGVTRVENTVAAEQAWRQSKFDLWNKFVFLETKGYYCGANIPGKKEEPLNWFGGLATYHKILTKSREEGHGEYAKTALKEDEPALVKKFSRVAVHAVPVNV